MADQTISPTDVQGSMYGTASVPAPTQTGSNLQELIQSAGQIGNTTPSVPATITGHTAAAPHIPASLQPRAMQSTQNQPITMQSGDIKRARRQNSIAGITNMINGFANKEKADKSAALTSSIESIMQAQQNIDNAQAVLKNDPQNADAQAVIESNKKLVEGKFRDKTLTKNLQKAFDISFIDPSKNNTPEVQAGQKAAANVKAATAAGIAYNTPQEKKIAEMANNPPPAKGQPVSPAQQPQQSATPYADQYLKSRPQTIETNPLYAAQLAQQQKQNQLYTQYVYPKIITALENTQKVKIANDAAYERAVLKSTTELDKANAEIAGRKDVANTQAAAAIKRQGMADSTRIRTTQMRIDALADPDPTLLKNQVLLQKLQGTTLQGLTKQINDTNAKTSQLTAQSRQLRDSLALPGADKVAINNQLAGLQAQIDMNNAFAKATDKQRKDATLRFTGADSGPESTSSDNSKPANTQPEVGPEDDSSSEDSVIDITKE